MAEELFRIKRTVLRYPFTAEVEVAGVSNGLRLPARISDLSVRGCYIDTLNPFQIRTDLPQRRDESPPREHRGDGGHGESRDQTDEAQHEDGS